jgi:hypothetical protein
MGAKIKSLTNLLVKFFFGAVFCAFGFKVWKEYQYGLKLFFFLNKKRSKNREYHADFKSVKKVLRKCTQKSYKQYKFDEQE